MRSRSEIDHAVVVDYYDGAYGPTIALWVSTREAMACLRELFSRLGTTERSEIAMETDRHVRFLNVGEVVVGVAPYASRSGRTLQVMHGGAPMAARSVRWTQDADGWTHCAELLEPFLQYDKPGHQYLTQEGLDDALVVVSYREPRYTG